MSRNPNADASGAAEPVLVVLPEESSFVATVTINRPDKLNALNREVLERLVDAIDRLRAHGKVRAAIVTGAGEKAFVAGADIASMRAMSSIEARQFSELGHRLGDRMESAPFAILAAVNGFALGGGFELALACDIIVAADHAQFGFPEPRVGRMALEGGMHRLARSIPLKVAMHMLLTGTRIAANISWMSGICSDRSSGIGARCALYSL